MNIILWIVQGLLAMVFIMAGGMKLAQPKEKILESGQGWVEDFSPGIIKGIGVLELLGILGLILPGLTGILPILTPLAAVGLMLTMLGAALTHFRRGEYPMVGMNAVLFTMAAFTAYGRFVLVPFV